MNRPTTIIHTRPRRANINAQVITADCLEWMRSQPDKSVDLVFCSPPYEDARLYDELGFKLVGDAWVQWAADRFVECCRLSRGLVAWVVAGRTRQYRWSATPALLMAELHRRGVNLRNPCIYERDGIPGSGGPDWLKSRYEWIVCASPKGRLAWSDPTAMGWEPKFPPGGPPSHQTRDGRVNRPRPLERRPNGTRQIREYKPPKKSNPGNIIACGPGGGGHMGDPHAHGNEAPFPQTLAEHFVRPFCPPGGTVLDIFGGSGTTAKVALMHGRRAISVDIRASQSELTARRLREWVDKQKQEQAA